MRNLRLIISLSLSLLVGANSGIAYGQLTASATQEPKENLATIYVYRLDKGTLVTGLFLGFLIKTRPVYFRELTDANQKAKNRKLAGLRNKQYFMMQLPAGKYVFDTRFMLRSHLELDVTGGEEYYLWLDQGNNCPDEDMDVPPALRTPIDCEERNAAVINVSFIQWLKDKNKLKPIKRGDVKDRSAVIIPATETDGNVASPTANQP